METTRKRNGNGRRTWTRSADACRTDTRPARTRVRRYFGGRLGAWYGGTVADYHAEEGFHTITYLPVDDEEEDLDERERDDDGPAPLQEVPRGLRRPRDSTSPCPPTPTRPAARRRFRKQHLAFAATLRTGVRKFFPLPWLRRRQMALWRGHLASRHHGVALADCVRGRRQGDDDGAPGAEAPPPLSIPPARAPCVREPPE